MARWCAERTTAAALAALEAANIPAGPVYSPQQAVDDPHVREARILRDVDYPGSADRRADLRHTRAFLGERRPACACARRCSASTPTRFCASSDMIAAQIAALRDEGVI